MTSPPSERRKQVERELDTLSVEDATAEGSALAAGTLDVSTHQALLEVEKLRGEIAVCAKSSDLHSARLEIEKLRTLYWRSALVVVAALLAGSGQLIIRLMAYLVQQVVLPAVPSPPPFQFG